MTGTRTTSRIFSLLRRNENCYKASSKHLKRKKDVTAEEIAKLQTDLSNMPPSNFRRIAVDDVTPESLVNLLEENGTLLMISDEAGMLGNFSGRYSNNIPNLDLLLKS